MAGVGAGARMMTKKLRMTWISPEVNLFTNLYRTDLSLIPCVALYIIAALVVLVIHMVGQCHSLIWRVPKNGCIYQGSQNHTVDT